LYAALQTPIEYLKGVGPQRADLLKKELQIFTYQDLLLHYPFRYIDRSKYYKISELHPDLPNVQIKGKLRFIGIAGDKRAKRLVAQLYDETGTIDLIWFKGIKWIQPALKEGVEYLIFGKPTSYNHRINIAHPDIELVSSTPTEISGNLQPVYSSSEKLNAKGLHSKGIEKLVKNLLPIVANEIEETLSEEIIQTYRFISKKEALIHIHFPENQQLLTKAENRLKFEELFFIQLGMLRMKINHQRTVAGFTFEQVGNLFLEFYNHQLAFELTTAQKKVVKEIRTDLGKGVQMNRLLQGDVGSGKTIVALLVMLIALDNQFQTCLMAPTEILAQQHFVSFQEMLQKMNISVGLLTGSTKTAERKKLHEACESGELNILIGTHALLEDVVKFKNLGLVIIDEQHRFGVAQRAKLWTKNIRPPHVLVMTATPIPRTLAMTFYGDLDVSVIDELPPGRKPIKTLHKYDSNRLAVFGFMKEQIKLGRQIYMVYPLIKESEKMDYKHLMDGYESVQRDFPDCQISIVHGQMKPADKEFEMNRFVKGETQIMVATTVIEVGVNVPNASVMVIESAERFGLSQLHQLRGRVGRGADQSYCILMTDYKLSADARVRMQTMVETNDGFQIAETDLKLRGPGDLLGTQQSGVLDLKLVNLSKDGQLIQLSRDIAQQVLKQDVDLTLEKHKAIRKEFIRSQKNKAYWGRIS
jgi:ATP-dependent DNA helicase RecG